MAFFFTLLYVVTAFVSPPVLFGPWAEYHVELIIAMLAFLSSIPALRGSGVLGLPQTKAILGLWFFVVLSVTTNTWLRGGVTALYNFVPVTFTYFLTALNCKTKHHLQLLFLALFVGSFYFILHGMHDLHANVTPSLYLYGDEGLRRLRGLGLVNDPNDFSQVMVSLVPCMFLLRKNSAFANAIFIGIPVALLVTGLYLAHSRGAAIGLMAIVILASRRKIGTVPAVAMASVLFAGSLAFGWSGGREVSMEAGADRLDAWVTGIEFIKAHPLLGIGNNRFDELNDITAHNSIVVCAAENGILGFICWVLFVFTSFRLGLRIVKTKTDAVDVQDAPTLLSRTPKTAWANMLVRAAGAGTAAPLAMAVPASLHAPVALHLPGWRTAPLTETAEVTLDDEKRAAQLLMFALTGFLTAGWFLSRALSPWMFMYGGLIVAVKRMMQEKGLALENEPFPLLMRWAVALSAMLLIVVYVLLKVRSLTSH